MKNIIIKIVCSVILLYAFIMIAIGSTFSLFTTNPENMEIYIKEQEIPYVICMISLVYSLCNIWKNKD